MIYKILKICVLIACMPMAAIDAMVPYLQLNDFERELDAAYVYVSMDCKQALLELDACTSLSFSQEFKEVCRELISGQLVVEYDMMVQVIKEGLNCVLHQKSSLQNAAQKLIEYKKALKSGEATVIFEDEGPQALRGSCCTSSKAFCGLFVRDTLQICGNLMVNGMTTLNSLLVQNNITVVNGTLDAPQGVLGAPALIPFASGLYTAGGGTIDAIPGESLAVSSSLPITNFNNLQLVAIGFGNSAVADGQNAPTHPDSIDYGGFAFDVPADGILFDLQVSVDSKFISDADGIKRFNFFIFISECVDGDSTVLTGYVQTDTFAFVDIDGTHVESTRNFCVSGCANIPGPICVHKGDRVVLIATMSTVAGDATTVGDFLEQLSLNAGIYYTPTSSTCARPAFLPTTDPLCPVVI